MIVWKNLLHFLLQHHEMKNPRSKNNNAEEGDEVNFMFSATATEVKE